VTAINSGLAPLLCCGRMLKDPQSHDHKEKTQSQQIIAAQNIPLPTISDRTKKVLLKKISLNFSIMLAIFLA
jgi:hypothetical protein